MPFIEQNIVRTSQPQQAVGINWSNPLTRGLVDVIDMRGVPRSLILGTPPTFFGSSQTYADPTPSGLAFSTLASAGGVAFIRSDGLYAPAEQSHVALAEYSISAGGWAGLFASSAGDGASGSFGLQRSYEGNCYIPGTAEPYLPIYYDIAGTGQNLIALTGDNTTTKVYKNGDLLYSGSNSPISRSTSRLVLSGERSASASYAHQSRQLFHLFYSRAITEDEVQSLQANPWQIFEDEEDCIWVPGAGGGGGATDLDGHAAAIASAAGALSVAVPITGAAVAVITVNGALSTALPLSGAAAAVSNAGGTLKIGIALSGAAIAQAVAGGTIGAGFALSGNAQAVAAANGSIKIQVAIAGSAIAQASASGNLGVSGGNALAGNAAAQSSATGGLSTSLPLAGSAQVIATASGNLTTGTPLSGAAVAVAAASGNLVVTVALSGAAVAQAIAQGGLALSVPLSGAAVAQAAASGILSGSGIITGPNYGRLTSTARHLTTLLHGAAHV